MDIVERLVVVLVVLMVVLGSDTPFAGLGRVQREGPQGVLLVERVDLWTGDTALEAPGRGGEVQLLPQVGPRVPFLDDGFLGDDAATQ